jgi:hypothetical protein
MVAPTSCAQAAVRIMHRRGAEPARTYLAESVVGEWANHANASMASNARAVLAGFDWYIEHAETDGRSMAALDRSIAVTLDAGGIMVRLDVVLEDGDGLGARVILWDAPHLDEAAARTSVYPFAVALATLFPGQRYTSIGVWQARRQELVEVPHAEALAQRAAANTVLEAITGS